MTKHFEDDDFKEFPNMRLTKPMMEKRRRARINHCLMKLKEMIVDSGIKKIQNPKCRYEKADILELTVEYLQQHHLSQESSQSTSSETPIIVSNELNYAEGFAECAKEVKKILSSPEAEQSSHESIVDNLMSHLQKCLHNHLIESQSVNIPNEQQKQVPHQRVIRHTRECESPKMPLSGSSSPTISMISSYSLDSSIASSFENEFSSSYSEDDAPLNLSVYGNERNGHCYQVMDIDCVWRPW